MLFAQDLESIDLIFFRCILSKFLRKCWNRIFNLSGVIPLLLWRTCFIIKRIHQVLVFSKKELIPVSGYGLGHLEVP